MTNTPGKIYMEAKDHPFEKENHLNQTSILVFQLLIFQRVVVFTLCFYCLLKIQILKAPKRPRSVPHVRSSPGASQVTMAITTRFSTTSKALELVD